MRSVLAALALGAGFGVATSLSNGLVSPFESDSFARLMSLTLGAGWAWAAVAVVAGWLAGAPARGALAGALALVMGTTAYYGMDSIVRQEPLTWYWPEMLSWWLASVVLGPALGSAGAYISRPGVLGLLARLLIPVGAILQMIVLPPGSGTATATSAWARVLVAAAAAAGAAAAVTRFLWKRRLSARARPSRGCQGGRAHEEPSSVHPGEAAMSFLAPSGSLFASDRTGPRP